MPYNATTSVEFNARFAARVAARVAPNQNLPYLIDLDAMPLPCLIGGLGSAHEKYAF